MGNSPTHYFASSVYGWNVADTVEAALAKRKRADRHSFVPWMTPTNICIYRVPLPIEAPYKIRQYVPVVEGTEQVEVFEYPEGYWKRYAARRK